MANRILPPQAYLRECFDYDPETGVLRWRMRPLHHFYDTRSWKIFNTQFAGQIAGTNMKHGHRSIHVDGRLLLGHRIIYKMMTGKEPPAILDHRDRKSGDNRWSQIRVATHAENMRNCKIHRNNTSGLKGVVFDKRRGSFCARIRVRGKNAWLGSFSTAEAAHAAYCEAAEQHFREFWSPG